jgi:hypothetical protein
VGFQGGSARCASTLCSSASAPNEVVEATVLRSCLKEITRPWVMLWLPSAPDRNDGPRIRKLALFTTEEAKEEGSAEDREAKALARAG